MSSRITLCQSVNALASAGTYTSPTMDVSQFKIVSGFIGSNAAGNLFVEYEMPDNPGTFVTTHTYPLAPPALQFYDFVAGRSIRFRYVNGATQQTSFNLAIFAEYL